MHSKSPGNGTIYKDGGNNRRLTISDFLCIDGGGAQSFKLVLWDLSQADGVLVGGL